MNESGNNMIESMDSHVQWKQKTKKYLICKHHYCFNNVKAVTCESCWSSCPRERKEKPFLCLLFIDQQILAHLASDKRHRELQEATHNTYLAK